MKTCVRCGVQIPSAKVFGWHLRECDRPFDLDVLYASLGIDRSLEGCWEAGLRSPVKVGVGYRKVEYAYVVVAETQWGRPEGKMVCHICDNRLCLRQDHVYWGTSADNARDAWRNGRRTMSDAQLQAMQDGLRGSEKHKTRMLEHNRALADRNRGAQHWTRRSPETMARWKAAINKEVVP